MSQMQQAVQSALSEIKRVKRGFYDFSVSPYSYDFAVFLMAARANECEEIVLVPGRRWVKGPDGKPVEFQKCTPGEQEYRLNAIIKGLCDNVIECQTREEAKLLWHKDCFPPGYTIEKPVQAHTVGAVLKQLKIMPFMPKQEYLDAVEADGWNDPRMVVITIRQSHIKSGRNSTVDEWIKAADWMRSIGLAVVFVPDTEFPDVDFGGHRSCPKAALDVQYRLALYEKAYLNVGVNNGPLALNMFSRRPMLYFRPITHGYHESTAEFWRANGVPVRSQMPWFSILQRIIWEGTDDFENIKLNVERWLTAREKDKDVWPLAIAPTYPIYGVGEKEERSKQMTLAMEAAKENGWKQMIRKSHGKEAMSIVCYGPSLKYTWQNIKRPILTVSGAHDFLIAHGIVPDYHTECDPRESKVKVFHAHQDVKYRMATCCHPKFWEFLKGHDVELWHLHNDAHTEEWVRENDPGANMLGGGSTVGMRALEVASMLGYRRFEIHGMDASYESDEVRHAGEHAGKKHNVVEVNVDGAWYKSSPQMVEAAKEVITFIQNYDCELAFHGTGLVQAMVKHFLNRFRLIDLPPTSKQESA